MDENNIDMLKVMEKAIELKKILEEKPQEKAQEKPEIKPELNKNDNQMDIAKIMQFAEILKSMNNKKPEEPPPEISPNREYKENYFFDDDIISPQLKSVKAVVPYLDYEKQKIVALAVKIIEAKKVIDYYERDEIKNAIVAQSTMPKNNSEVLGAVRPYLDNEKKYIIDMIEKIFEIKEIMEKFNHISSNKNL